MDKYIKLIDICEANDCFNEKHDCDNCVFNKIPTADVQPVDRWISVDEALPIYDELVLAVDKNNTIRLGIYTDLGWTSQFGNPMVAHITHWRPLPEPPKQ